MPNGMYGGVRGEETKVGQKTFVSRPTRFAMPVHPFPRAADSGNGGVRARGEPGVLGEKAGAARQLTLRRAREYLPQSTRVLAAKYAWPFRIPMAGFAGRACGFAARRGEAAASVEIRSPRLKSS